MKATRCALGLLLSCSLLLGATSPVLRGADPLDTAWAHPPPSARRAPELWNAVTGERRFATKYEGAGGRTRVPLEFSPSGSWFVVFRAPAAAHPATGRGNAPRFERAAELSGPWNVRFDPRWGGPAAVEFAELVVIGDAALPEAQRLTKTNILELKANTPLTDSGLLGPVTLGTINLRE